MLFCAISLFAEQPVCRSKGAGVKVVYPDFARRMKIMGIVRLELELSPSGTVRASKILGGNPVLASAAQDAVKQARFEGTDSCVVIFEFK
jgi:TonB family protein